MPLVFFFNDTATTEIYTLSLPDALPISLIGAAIGWLSFFDRASPIYVAIVTLALPVVFTQVDRKSTRLNSSHSQISYAVFCLKKKKHEQCARLPPEPPPGSPPSSRRWPL